MTFGVNVNHISQGLLSGSYPGLVIDTKQAAIPFVCNIIDAITLANYNAIQTNPKPKVFVGTMKFSTTPVSDSSSLQISDPANNYTFYYTDSNAINGQNEKFFTMPIIATKITSTLNAKYSLCLFGYFFEYSI